MTHFGEVLLLINFAFLFLAVVSGDPRHLDDLKTRQTQRKVMDNWR